jgi:type II secretory pathway component PulF
MLEGVSEETISYEVDVPQSAIIHTEEFSNAMVLLSVFIFLMIFIWVRRKWKKRKIKKKMKN